MTEHAHIGFVGQLIQTIFDFFIDQFGFMGLGVSIAVLIIIMIIQAIIAPIASEGVLFVSGLIFYEAFGVPGVIAAFVGGVIGSLLGAWIAFKIARWVQSIFKDRVVDSYSDIQTINVDSRKERYLHKFALFLARFIDEDSEHFIDIIEKKGFTIVLLGRLILIMPFDAISYGAGLSRINFKDFMNATVIGTIPRVLAYVMLGARLSETLANDPNTFIFIAMLFAVGIYGMYKLSMRYIKKNDEKEPEESNPDETADN